MHALHLPPAAGFYFFVFYFYKAIIHKKSKKVKANKRLNPEKIKANIGQKT